MGRLAGILIFVAGAFNVYSVIGVLGPGALTRLYGIAIDDPDLLILMRHRAVLFGVLGGFLVWSAFRPALRRAAIGAGLISMVSIIAIAVTSGGYNALLQRIVWVDAALSAGLVLARVLDAAAARR
jgi:hypothetical protein